MPLIHHSDNETSSSQLAAARLRHERERLFRETLAAGLISSNFPNLLSKVTDRYFQSRYLEIQAAPDRLPAHPFTVLAVGGYGRSELCPRSDLDVLVLFQESVPESAAEFCRELFLPLWDLGLELGHGVRGLKECLALATTDHATFTSLLSARYLVGENLLASRFIHEFIDLIAHADPLSLSALAKNHEFQDEFRAIPELPAESLLEPNLKNGSGGLRDYHRLLWLSIPGLCHEQNRIITRPVGPFSEEDELQLRQDATFLLQTRTALHLITGRKTDVLHLDLQAEVAHLMGYAATHSGLAVETFLAALHKVMQRIRSMSHSVQRTIHAQFSSDSSSLVAIPSELNHEQGIVLTADGLAPQRNQSFLTGKQVMSLFQAMASTGLPLSWTARRPIQAACSHLLVDLGERIETLQLLTGILLAPGGRLAGREMLESGVLAALIPEFGIVQDRIQFDAYHLRPLGAHTMETVSWVGFWMRQETQRNGDSGALRRESLAPEALRRLPNATSLVLGALLHDIGKGAADHEIVGAEMAESILRRFHTPEPLLREATFLVRNHLLLFKTATRKDLHDEQVVVECAQHIETSTQLDRLFLLSEADARATGPKAWNAWTASLLHELYVKIRKLFVHGPLSAPQAMERAAKTRAAVKKHFLVQMDLPRGLDEQLEGLPPRYLLTTSVENIIRHLRLVACLTQDVADEKIRIPESRAGLGVAAVETVDLPDKGCHEVIFAVLEQPGIFPVLCGVLTLHGLDVLAAEVVTWPGSVVLTIFKIQDPPDLLHVEELTLRLKRAVKYAMTGKLFLNRRLEEKRRSLLLSPTVSTGMSPSVRIDNHSSDFSTQVEIIADDRPGCLYQIADTFERLQVRVYRAKIATQADRIADSFDIRDPMGQKITDPAHLQEIQTALLFCLQKCPN